MRPGRFTFVHGSRLQHRIRRSTLVAVVIAALLVAAAVAIPAIGGPKENSATAAKAAKLAREASRRSDRVLDAVAGTAPGTPGPQGAKGDKGADGQPGTQGQSGGNGGPGGNGGAGSKGRDGAAGADGADGLDGATIVARARSGADQETCSFPCNQSYSLAQNPSWHQSPGEIDVVVAEIVWSGGGACSSFGVPGFSPTISVDGRPLGFASVSGADSSPATIGPFFVPAGTEEADRHLTISFQDDCTNDEHFTISDVQIDVGELHTGTAS